MYTYRVFSNTSLIYGLSLNLCCSFRKVHIQLYFGPISRHWGNLALLAGNKSTRNNMYAFVRIASHQFSAVILTGNPRALVLGIVSQGINWTICPYYYHIRFWGWCFLLLRNLRVFFFVIENKFPNFSFIHIFSLNIMPFIIFAFKSFYYSSLPMFTFNFLKAGQHKNIQ